MWWVVVGWWLVLTVGRSLCLILGEPWCVWKTTCWHHHNFYITRTEKDGFHLWKRTVTNTEHELPMNHAIAPCSFNKSPLNAQLSAFPITFIRGPLRFAGNLGLGGFNSFLGKHIISLSQRKQGLVYLQTQTRHHFWWGNPSKLPCICILSWLIWPKWVIQWPLKQPRIRSPTNQGLTTFPACTMLHQHLGEWSMVAATRK